jgi:glycerol-3-phosphate dehydrogenase subunit B
MPYSKINLEKVECDVLIIGAGLAGISSAFFLSENNVDVLLAGNINSLRFSSGLLDLAGEYPLTEKSQLSTENLKNLCNDFPEHPYGKLSNDERKEGFEKFITFLNTTSFKYSLNDSKNYNIFTSIGTTKETHAIPQSMLAGVKALKDKEPSLILGFKGLREFSSKQIETVLKDEWPLLRSEEIYFPDTENVSEVHLAHIAQALDSNKILDRLVDMIRPLLKEEVSLGIPPILGIHKTDQILKRLEEKLNVAVYEIPIQPVSIPGYRLANIFQEYLVKSGNYKFIPDHIISVNKDSKGNFIASMGNEKIEKIIQAKTIILASGRFFGKGLNADRKKIYESIFNLPLYQPESREDWHDTEFFSKNGHEINRAGIMTDSSFHPIDESKKIIDDNLYAVGSILAFNDWFRLKTGAGVSILSAYKAVKDYLVKRK